MAAIFTLGNCQPCYFKCSFQECRELLFYPHSRNESGLMSAVGLATLTRHITVYDLSLFIKHVSASLRETGTVPFEISIIQEPEAK